MDVVVDFATVQETEAQVAEAELLWNASAEILRAQVSEAVWHTTFADVEPLAFADGLLVLAVPSGLMRERIEGRYLALVRDALHDVRPDIDLAIQVRAPERPVELQDDVLDELAGVLPVGAVPPPSAAAAGPGADAPAPVADAPRGPESVNPKHTFEAFVTGASNRFAHAAALSVAETPARSYNPLFIYGHAGLGKTHLLHGIANYVLTNYAHYQVRYVSCETLMNEFVDAIRGNTTAAFRRRYRESDILLIDDIQFMEGRVQLQEEIFHTFNTLHAANRQIVISSDRKPDALATLEDRLRSRFKMGLITDIQPPELETRLAILRKKAEREPSPVRDDVLAFIATHITDNIRELEGALNRVTAFASLNKVPLDVSTAERVLADILDTQPKVITPQQILDATSKKFGFPVEELRGKSRRRPLVNARQVGMYVFRELTDLSYPAIAREFGGRDHTTVIHAVEKIGALMKERRQTFEQVTELIQSIKAGA